MKFKSLTLDPSKIYEGIFVVENVPHVAYRQRMPNARNQYYDVLTLEPFQVEEVTE